MLPGLEVTAAPGCFCFTSQRGGGDEEESKAECPVHLSNTVTNDEAEIGNQGQSVGGESSDVGERILETVDTLNADALQGDADKEGEEEAAGNSTAERDLNNISPHSSQLYQATTPGASKEGSGNSGNDARWNTLSLTLPHVDEVEDSRAKEFESPHVSTMEIDKKQPDRMMLDDLPDSAEFFAGLHGSSATTSTQVMVDEVDDIEEGQRINSSENQDLETGKIAMLDAELGDAVLGEADQEGEEEDLQEKSLEANLDGRDYGEVEENDSVSPGASIELGSNKPNRPTKDQQDTFTDFVDLPDVGVLTRRSRRILEGFPPRLTSQGQPRLEVGENEPTPEAKATGSKSCSVPRKRNVGNSKKQQENDQEAGEGGEDSITSQEHRILESRNVNQGKL